jgi:hypothetical protein
VHTLGVLRSSFDLLQLSVKISLSLWWWDSSEWLDDEVQDSADAILVPGSGVLAERIAGDLEAALWRSSWSDRGVPPTGRLLVVLALAVAMLA